MERIESETHRAEFIRLAKLLRARIERATGPQWWEESEAENLTHQLEDARQRLGIIPEVNCDFEESPAFLVAKSSATYLGTHLARAYGVHELVERLPWCYVVTMAVWSDPLIDGSHSRQCLHAIIDKKAYADEAAEQGREPNPDGPNFLLSGGSECCYVGPNEYRATEAARAVAVESLNRWIEAIQLATIPAAEELSQASDSNAERRNKTFPTTADRNGQWLRWRQEFGLTDAQIRDKWNYENPQRVISERDKKAGAELVKKTLKRMTKPQETKEF